WRSRIAASSWRLGHRQVSAASRRCGLAGRSRTVDRKREIRRFIATEGIQCVQNRGRLRTVLDRGSTVENARSAAIKLVDNGQTDGQGEEQNGQNCRGTREQVGRATGGHQAATATTNAQGTPFG